MKKRYLALLLSMLLLLSSCGKQAASPEPSPSSSPVPTATPTPTPTATQTQAPSPSHNAEQSEDDLPTFSVSLDDFRKSFNGAMTELKSFYQMPSVRWSGDNFAVTAEISNNLSLLFIRTLSSPKTISEISFYGLGNGTEQSGLDIICCISAAIVSIDPSIPLTDTGAMILEMIGDTDEGSITKNGAIYYLSISAEEGTFFMITPET